MVRKKSTKQEFHKLHSRRGLKLSEFEWIIWVQKLTWYPWGVVLFARKLACDWHANAPNCAYSKAPQVFPPLSLSWHYIHFRVHRSAALIWNILKRRVRNWAVDWIKLMVFGNLGVRKAVVCLLCNWRAKLRRPRDSFDFLESYAPLLIDEAIATLSIYSINARGSWPTSGGKLFLDASTHEGEFLNISRKPHVAICGAIKICDLLIGFQTHTHIIKFRWNEINIMSHKVLSLFINKIYTRRPKVNKKNALFCSQSSHMMTI